jgi:hypothetical protein
MRVILILLWLLLPLAALAYHRGPGVDARGRDAAADAVALARTKLEADDPAGAVRAFDEALARLPAADVATARRLRLERAKARMEASQLAQASQELGALVDELQADPASGNVATDGLADDARDALATSDFFVAWLKRLEGLSRDEWEPHTEAARQTWRLLADRAEARGDTAARDRHVRDLEAVIRLARMDPEELQGLPIPSECNGCKSGKCRSCNGKGRKPGRNPGQAAKKEDARGAGGGPPPDGSGS